MLVRLATALVTVIVGVASFYGVHFAQSVLADEEPNDISEIMDALEVHSTKDRHNGLVNNIMVSHHADEVPDVEGGLSFSEPSPCMDHSPPTPSTDVGDLHFEYPASWHLLAESSITCGDTVMQSYREFELLSDRDADIEVTRWRRVTGVKMSASTDRVEAITVNGRQAVQIKPIRTESGYAILPDRVVVTEPWGLTMVEVWETANSPTARDVALIVTTPIADEETE